MLGEGADYAQRDRQAAPHGSVRDHRAVGFLSWLEPSSRARGAPATPIVIAPSTTLPACGGGCREGVAGQAGDDACVEKKRSKLRFHSVCISRHYREDKRAARFITPKDPPFGRAARS